MARHELDPENEPEKVFDNVTRRAIARVCRQGPQTIYSMQQRLGKEDGELRPIVGSLKKWKVLLEAPGSTKRRRIYVFNTSWDAQLKAAIRRHNPDWIVGQQVLLVRPEGVGRVAKKLADDVDEEMFWGLGFRDMRGILIGLDEEISNAKGQALQSQLVDNPDHCELATVEELVPASQLRDYGERMTKGT